MKLPYLSLDEIMESARVAVSVPRLQAANAHVHLPPNYSAFASVDQAVELAASQDVRILGASNYYDFSIYPRFGERCLEHGIYPLFGLEITSLIEQVRDAGILINDPGNPGKMYLCGKGITRFVGMTDGARDLLGLIRRNDRLRMRRMTALLAEIFAAGGVKIDLHEEDILDSVAWRHDVERETITLQERHLAQAFQQEFFKLVPPSERSRVLSTVIGQPVQINPEDQLQAQNAIRSGLMKAGKPAFVEESFVDLAQAFRLILELGGIPCYPTLADGASPICAYENPPEKLIRTLESNSIFCVEFIPTRNDPDVLTRYVTTFRAAGFVVTAGTEHNTEDLPPLAPTCRNRQPLPEALECIFLEGAHVVAAHQFLSLRGRAGYVDGSGRLNPAFADREERIQFFRQVGMAVVALQVAGAYR